MKRFLPEVRSSFLSSLLIASIPAISLLLSACSKTEPLAQTAIPKPPQELRKILALGDSLTAGLGVNPEESYPAKLQTLLQENGYAYEVVNAWASWDTSDGLRERASLYLAEKPDLVLIVIGGNDGLRALPTTNLEENILKIVDLYESAGVKVVLAGMDVPLNLGETYRKDFLQVYKDVAEKRKHVVLYDFFLEWVTGDPILNQADQMHPNPAGYDTIVKKLYDFLEEKKLITHS